jgi:hypothetical protein
MIPLFVLLRRQASNDSEKLKIMELFFKEDQGSGVIIILVYVN